MTKKKPKPPPLPVIFPRADPQALAQFDPTSKGCAMNCGPHRDDPRRSEEIKFLCDDCVRAGD